MGTEEISFLGGLAMTTIMPAFDTFLQEGAIVGRLLVGYGELELELCNCVAAARADYRAWILGGGYVRMA